MNRASSTQSTDNPNLALEEQRYGDNPLSDRETEQYRNEYITAFVGKWDSLIDWSDRRKSEDEFLINIPRSRHKTTVLDAVEMAFGIDFARDHADPYKGLLWH